MRTIAQFACLTLFLALAASLPAQAGGPESGVIRLAPSASTADEESDDQAEASDDAFGGPRRGFDYENFVTRLEALWFQRKTLLADGRDSDADEQSQLIRAFCAEEGIRRLDHLAGALVAEADRHLREGRYDRAFAALELADALDPGRPQTHMALAAVTWKSGRHRFRALGELGQAMKFSMVRSAQDLSLFNRLALVIVVAVVACVLVFSLLMLVRYQIPFRHEIEERVVQVADDRLARAAGWAVLFLPMLLWVGTGWAALYWIAITFRFMRRAERLAAVVLLLSCVVAVPAYRMAVSVYGLTADPVVRTTLASADGEYAPDRVLKLRQLVYAYPEDPVYRFLLAGLYKNGRYFEESFAAYRDALKLDPAMEEAHINVGNIFYTTGQYSEALANYNRALEVNPGSILAYFNMHLAQSESFRFKEAEESLNMARDIDAQKLADMLSSAGNRAEGPAAIDATLQIGSVWDAALGGGEAQQLVGNVSRGGFTWFWRQFINPVSLVAVVALLACGGALLAGRAVEAARRCIRCGRPFCNYCKSSREGHEYCSQCLHLFVLGDGLAPETKTRKLYEVERHERATRNGRRLLSTFIPGSGQLLRGRTGLGILLIIAWLAALVTWQPIVVRPLDVTLGLNLGLDLLGPESVPAIYTPNPAGVAGFIALLLLWFLGNVWRWNRREA